MGLVGSCLYDFIHYSQRTVRHELNIPVSSVVCVVHAKLDGPWVVLAITQQV